MKVIAIKDAPDPSSLKLINLLNSAYDRAYYKGDIFEVYEPGRDWLIINHHIFGITMAVKNQNFITLEEYREKKFEQLEIQ